MIVGYSRAAPGGGGGGLSVVQSWTDFDNTQVDPIVFDMPASTTSGNTLLVVFCTQHEGAVAVDRVVDSVPSGWSLVAEINPAGTYAPSRVYAYRKTADGTEGGGTASWGLSGILEWMGVGFEIAGDRTGEGTMNDASGDPPEHTHSGGSAETLWFAIWTSKYGENAVTAAPSGYAAEGNPGLTQVATADQSDWQGDARVAVTYKISTAGSENPGTFTLQGGALTNDVQSGMLAFR